MEKVKDEKKIICFESVTLLEELIREGQLRNLKNVKSSKYPKYCFDGTEKVVAIVSSFLAIHNLKCDRSIDEDWSVFEDIIINAEKKPEAIVTRNLQAVKRIAEEGYGYMLKRTGVDQYKKKFFVFYSNDRIVEIKAEEDLRSKERYETKHDTSKQEESNVQMSQLLKKAMEGKNNDK